MKYIKHVVLLVTLVSLVGCAGMGFGYKDPEAGVEVVCVTEKEVTSCYYIGADGKEVSVDMPVQGEDTVPK